MALASVVVAGDVVGTLHTPYQCPACHEPLAVLWVHTPLGILPQACDLAARPVTNCPACSAPVDALGLWAPAPDTMLGSKRQ